MKRKISLFTVFTTVFLTSIIYQNCSGGSGSINSQKPSEGNETLEVEGGETKFTVNLNNGGHILYKIAVSDLNAHPSMAGEDPVSSNLISLKFGHHFLENTLYRDGDVDTNTSCSESAFPHCLSVRERKEHKDILGYRFVHSPLKCHWQYRLSKDERISLFAHIQSIKYSVITEAGTTQPTNNKCTLSSLSFSNGTENLLIILDYDLYEDSACLPSETKYASSGNIDELKNFFKSEIDELTVKKNSEEDFCNNYSAYSANTTNWIYHSDNGYSFYSGFTKARYNKETSTVRLRWKEETANSQIQCADNVPLETNELTVFFPEEGLKYEFLYYDDDGDGLVRSTMDAPIQYIIYEDPFDKGNKWKFYKNEYSIQSGGAILKSSQMESIKNTIEGLISRAKSQNLLNTNCGSGMDFSN